MAESTTSARRIANRLKRKQAVELRLRGKKYREIAESLGTSTNYAWQLVDKELTWVAQKRQEKGVQLIQLSLDRLDALLEAMWDKAVGGNEKAVLAILKIEERRARLQGLDAPKKLDVTATGRYDNRTDEELETEAARRGLNVIDVDKQLKPVKGVDNVGSEVDYREGVGELAPTVQDVA